MQETNIKQTNIISNQKHAINKHCNFLLFFFSFKNDKNNNRKKKKKGN